MYTARRGDTLITIADRFGVSLNELRRWNRMEGVKVEPGRRLHVAEPASAPSVATRTHRRASSGGKTAESNAKVHGSASSKTATHAPASHAATRKSSGSSAKSAHAAGAKAKLKSAKKQ
jgi:membrane-bound lytic murein transglycosylase D